MWDVLQTQLYELSQTANALVVGQLGHLTWVSVGVIFLAGLLTSLTPCTLSMLPITIGYIAGSNPTLQPAISQPSASQKTDSPTGQSWQGAIQSLWFSLGMATTLAGLGIVATLLGKVYGQIGVGLPIAVGLVAILMGLNQLELLPLRMPAGLGLEWISQELPLGLRSYLIGVTFGLVASPCSTPVLATLLTWLASTQDPILGGSLLLCYTAGYVAPLVLAGTFTASLKQILELRKWSGWITPTSGVLMIGVGVFAIVSRLPVF
ncbi:MAG: cytochrome c biogenesis protein CcdA [Synechococcales bacterium]|nr:cytochrome c biogenesis protein CcdA [Synechococcales bacterium]